MEIQETMEMEQTIIMEETITEIIMAIPTEGIIMEIQEIITMAMEQAITMVTPIQEVIPMKQLMVLNI